MAMAQSSSETIQYIMHFQFCGWRYVFT